MQIPDRLKEHYEKDNDMLVPNKIFELQTSAGATVPYCALLATPWETEPDQSASTCFQIIDLDVENEQQIDRKLAYKIATDEILDEKGGEPPGKLQFYGAIMDEGTRRALQELQEKCVVALVNGVQAHVEHEGKQFSLPLYDVNPEYIITSSVTLKALTIKAREARNQKHRKIPMTGNSQLKALRKELTATSMAATQLAIELARAKRSTSANGTPTEEELQEATRDVERRIQEERDEISSYIKAQQQSAASSAAAQARAQAAAVGQMYAEMGFRLPDGSAPPKRAADPKSVQRAPAGLSYRAMAPALLFFLVAVVARLVVIFYNR